MRWCCFCSAVGSTSRMLHGEGHWVALHTGCEFRSSHLPLLREHVIQQLKPWLWGDLACLSAVWPPANCLRSLSQSLPPVSTVTSTNDSNYFSFCFKKWFIVLFLIVSIGVVCVKVFAHELVPLGARGIGSPGVTDHNCPTWALGIKPWYSGRVVCARKCWAISSPLSGTRDGTQGTLHHRH